MEIKHIFTIRRRGSVFIILFMATLTTLISLATPVSARDAVLTIRQEGKDFEDAFRGLRDELSSDFDVTEHIIDKKCTVDEMTGLMTQHKPKLVVLMDNSAIALFRKYQATLPANAPFVPSVAIMGVMIKNAIADLKNAAGISYEVPVVTSIVSLRAVLGLPMKKVGIVNRDFLKDFIGENRDFCKRENIDVVSISLPNKADSYKPLLKKALENIAGQGIDVLWVPNDNALLQPDIIQNVWVPAVRKSKIPVVVGVEVLISPKLNFGTFAVLPDHVSLGSQAAGLVFDIMDNDWVIDELRVDPPLAVYKIINLPQAKKNFNVSDEKLKSVDKKVKF